MPRGSLSFKESDITRAIRAVMKAGLAVYEVKIKDGEIRLVLQAGGLPEPGATPLQEWRAKKRLIL
jgi:hypothetical protein